MANGFVKISDLPELSRPVDGSELAVLVQDGTTSKANLAQVFEVLGGQQEVFIGLPGALPERPALVFNEIMIDGQAVFQLAVVKPE